MQAVTPVYIGSDSAAEPSEDQDAQTMRPDTMFANPTYATTVNIGGNIGSSTVDTYSDAHAVSTAVLASGGESAVYMDPQSVPSADPADAESFYMDASVVEDAAALGNSDGGGKYPTMHVKMSDPGDLYTTQSDVAAGVGYQVPSDGPQQPVIYASLGDVAAAPSAYAVFDRVLDAGSTAIPSASFGLDTDGAPALSSAQDV